MGALEPSWHLLLLPALLTVGGESGASAAVLCLQLRARAGQRAGRDRTAEGEGWAEEGSSRASGSLPELEAPRSGTW